MGARQIISILKMDTDSSSDKENLISDNIDPLVMKQGEDFTNELEKMAETNGWMNEKKMAEIELKIKKEISADPVLLDATLKKFTEKPVDKEII